MKIYKANKKGFLLEIALFLLIPFVVFWFLENNRFLNLLILLIPFFLLLWIYFDTSYKIKDTTLLYRSAFIRGKIDIHSIHQITVGKTMWSGIKPALAKNGLILKYNTYDEIYIAPVSNAELVADLLVINPQIKIIETTLVSG